MSDAATTIATLQKNSQESVIIALDEWKGHHLVDLRVYARYATWEEPKATKKGVALRVEQLPSLIEALQAAATEARRRGLLPD
jgi:hypothetical protein